MSETENKNVFDGVIKFANPLKTMIPWQGGRFPIPREGRLGVAMHRGDATRLTVHTCARIRTYLFHVASSPRAGYCIADVPPA